MIKMENQKEILTDALLNKFLTEEKQKKESQDLFMNRYLPAKSKSEQLQEEEFLLRQRLFQIQNEKGNTAKLQIELQKEIQRRRRAWEKKEYERKLSQNQLSMSFVDTLKPITRGGV